MNETQIDQEIQAYLEDYKVDFPNEEEIDASIQYILTEAPVKKRRRSIFKQWAKTLMFNSIQEMLTFGWIFWILNGMFLLLGILSLVQLKTDPYITLFTLAPLPFFIGLVEILKSRNSGMVELEMTLKYNAQQILTSRLLVVGLYNLLINVVISVICVQLYPEIVYSKLLLSWTVPYVFVTAVAFLVAMNIKGNTISAILTSSWFAICYSMIQVVDMGKIPLEWVNFAAVGVLILGVLVWIWQIIKFKQWGEKTYDAQYQ